MLVRRVALCAAALSVAAACGGGNPAGPDPASTPGPAGASLRVVGDPVIDMTRGDTRALQIEERDSAGEPVARATRDYTFNSSSPGTVSVAPDGTLRAIATYGGAAITVRSPAGLMTTSHVWVQPPPDAPSTYRISFIFSENVPAGWRADFEWAARQYEHVIRAALPPVALANPALLACDAHPGQPPIPRLTGVETGTRIYVGRRSDAGPASGQPCLQRPMPRPTVIVGRVSIGTDGEDPPRPGRRLVLHEIGHALGLVGASTGLTMPWIDHAQQRYSGAFAREGYRRTFGVPALFLEVPGSHWAFGGDIMSATMPVVRITKASAGALMDMGYPAAWYGAY